MINEIKKQIKESIAIKELVLKDKDLIKNIELSAKAAIKAYKQKKKIMVCGNGGSAADAQHFVGELVSRFYFDRPGLNAVALTTNTTVLTAIGNDYGFEKLFERQVEALGNKGDILIGISTSGNSVNVVKAFEKAKGLGITTISLTGMNICKMDDFADISLHIPSNETPRIQESQFVIEHILCYLIEKELFGSNE